MSTSIKIRSLGTVRTAVMYLRYIYILYFLVQLASRSRHIGSPASIDNFPVHLGYNQVSELWRRQ